MGPVDLLPFREEIIALISALNVGVMVKKSQFLWGSYSLNDWQENLFFDWISGTTEWKKSLNIFAIVVDSALHFPLLRKDEGISQFLL